MTNRSKTTKKQNKVMKEKLYKYFKNWTNINKFRVEMAEIIITKTKEKNYKNILQIE